MAPPFLKSIIRELEEYESLATGLKKMRMVAGISAAAAAIIAALRKGRKVLIFGNGGSAAEAQHFAAELVGRFRVERRALPAIALTANSSVLTAQANDIGFPTIFSRQIAALAEAGDVVLGLTTSDARDSHSLNILNGFREARRRKAKTIGLFSARTKDLLKVADCAVIVPHTETSRIQEVHLLIIHILCGLVDAHFKPRG